MVLALAGFLWMVLDSHRRAEDLLAHEAPIPHEMRERAQQGVAAEAQARGYRFFWTEGGEWEPVLIARPVEAGRTGVRWFATRTGEEIYEYDPTVFSMPRRGLNPRPIQKYLSVPERRRDQTPLPAGWRPLH